MKVMKEEINDQVDFLAIRVEDNNTVESPSVPKSCERKNRKREFNLEELVDNCTSELQHENKKLSRKSKSKSPLISVPASKPQQQSTKPAWVQNKDIERKTYGRRPRGGVQEDESPVYSGEVMSGDEDHWRTARLPLVAADTGADKVTTQQFSTSGPKCNILHNMQVGRWLDLNSQPPPGQSTESTPVTGGGLRAGAGSSSTDLSDLSPYVTSVLSPIDTNIDRNKGAQKGNEIPEMKPDSRRSSTEDTVILSQNFENSCPVEVNDTFDKLLLESRKHNMKGVVKNINNVQECEFICSQTSSASIKPLFSPSVSKNIMKTLESTTDSDLSDLEPATNRLKSPSQGWNKAENSLNEMNKVNKKRSKKRWSLEFYQDHPGSSNKLSALDLKEDVTESKSKKLDTSVEVCQGWNSQEARQAKGVTDKYKQLLENHQDSALGDEATPARTARADHTKTDALKANNKAKVAFSLIGRIAPKDQHQQLRHRRRKVANFFQLGCLASPSVKRINLNLPNLQMIVNRNKRQGTVSPPPESSDAVLSNECDETDDGGAIIAARKEASAILDNENGRPSLLKAHIDKVSSRVKTPDALIEGGNLTDTVPIDPSVCEEKQVWTINKSPMASGTNKSMMEEILGDNNDIYTQDRETKDERISRIAKIEFEQELSLDRKNKRALIEDSEEDIQDFDSPMKRNKKVARIESDSEDTQGSCIEKTPERPKSVSKFRAIVAARRSRLSASKSRETEEHPEAGPQSRSLLSSPAADPGTAASRSSTSATSVSDSEQDTAERLLTTQQMQTEIAAAEERARRLREAAREIAVVGGCGGEQGDDQEPQEGGRESPVEPMLDLDDDTVTFMEGATSQKLLPVNADIVLDTETMAVDPARYSEGETRMVPDSDEDMFGLTPDRPDNLLPATDRPPLSPVEEVVEEEVHVEEEEPVVRPDTSSWRFVLSGVSGATKKTAIDFIDSLECLGVSSKVEQGVTHVIVKTGTNLGAQRTLKFLQAVASGVMIVSSRWIEACLQDPANLARADQWETLDEELGGANGPFRSRKSREEGRKPLLAGFELFVDGEVDGLDKSNIDDLLQRVGARTVPTVNLFSCSPGVTRLVLVNSAAVYGAAAGVRMLTRWRLAVVDKDWLLDSLCSHTVRPLRPYTADTVELQQLLRAGYTGPLVAEQ